MDTTLQIFEIKMLYNTEILANNIKIDQYVFPSQ